MTQQTVLVWIGGSEFGLATMLPDVSAKLSSPKPACDNLWFVDTTTNVACAHCGKESKKFWTMRVPFRVGALEPFLVTKGKVLYPAGTCVCRDHLLQPEKETALAMADAGMLEENEE